MPYPKRLLNDYEELAVDLHPHWWFFAGPVLALIVSVVLGGFLLTRDGWSSAKWVAVGLIGLSAIWLLVRYLRWGTTHFVVTSDRVIFRTGVIGKRGIEIPLERVNSVHFGQSVFERMIGAGDLLVESGAEGGQQRFTDIRNPDRVQNTIHHQKNLKRERRSADSPNSSVPDLTAQIERLEALRERGTLTPDEFEVQKQRLLGQ